MNTLRRFYRLSRPFWQDRQQWLAWLMLAAVIGLGLLIVQINVLINSWSKTFYDTLASFDTAGLYGLAGEYALYLGLYVLIYVALDYIRKGLVLRWRQAMTGRLVDAWLGDQAFYRLGLSGEPDNPDQRIAQDVDLMVDLSIELVASLVVNLAQVGAFVVILWNLSGVQTFSLFGESYTVHGYLVWIVLAYTVIGSVVTHLIGKPLHVLNYEREHREADFRASLLRKRDHAEQIALYQGEGVERQQLAQRFRAIADNWRQLMGRERDLSLFTVAYQRFSLIVPVFAALPAFMAKTITLGGLMQIRSAFNAVHDSLSWFIKLYHKLVRWSAALERLDQFERAIEASRQQVIKAPQGSCLCMQGLTLCRPDGSTLLSDLELRVGQGQWLRLAGRSGLGKSTLLRTLQGLWPYCLGDWQLPPGRSLLLPQKPYLPQMSLRGLLAYPQVREVDDRLLIDALGKVGLAGLSGRLQDEAEWERVLSGGEQQRLSLARALLYRPDTLYLDEATSQLDFASARGLLVMLRHELPACTVVGVTHQAGLAELFERTLELEKQPALV
ncbi:Inner membrane ABC transporter ATP-binding protein YddA [Pseudomonas reidholzensis]|uniref:Inner membrane ABC transporter ATP-binding protein YddA n=1 Tax=Pseudomonas reidholzensis TaxID=1785162 RepID=A0A383RMC4_9PSED|nr:ABC transporter ATP-binding protein/permease [Pseudomonas reidholzensis]SYX88230.1 Inner membrane ABC transporter ATP-binding protein YddA [Pseudomonas reidholzensis]